MKTKLKIILIAGIVTAFLTGALIAHSEDVVVITETVSIDGDRGDNNGKDGYT